MEVKVLQICSPSRIIVRPKEWDRNYNQLKKSFNDYHNFEVLQEEVKSFEIKSKSLVTGDVVR